MKKTIKFLHTLGLIILTMYFIIFSCTEEEVDKSKSTYTLTVDTSGNGTVTVSPDKSKYTDGDKVILTAIPDSNNSLYRWTGSYNNYGNEEVQIKMNSNKTVTADFIEGNVYYVKEGASGDGTFTDPWGEIQTAIDNAVTPAKVFVASGSYESTTNVAELREGVSLYGGFNSGFSDRKYETAAERENPLYLTKLQNINSAATGISNAVSGIVTITSDTIIEGFTIMGGERGTNAGFYLLNQCSPTIQYNTIIGGNVNNGQGIICNNSSPTIQYNKIVGGNNCDSVRAVSIAYITSNMTIRYNDITGGESNYDSYGLYINNTSVYLTVTDNIIIGGMNTENFSYGIRETNSSSTIKRNIISSGTGTPVSSMGIILGDRSNLTNNVISGGNGDTNYGIRTDSTEISKIMNNTINGGGNSSSSTVYGIYLDGSEAYIRNNIIFTTGGIDQYGIYEAGSTSLFGLNNNNIFDCGTALYRDADGSGNLTDIADVNDYAKTSQSDYRLPYGNISIDLIDNSGSYYFTDWDGTDDDVDTLLDNDWSLTSDAPVNVRGGAFDLTSLYTIDINGTARTTSTPTGMTNEYAGGLSMGAYERD